MIVTIIQDSVSVGRPTRCTISSPFVSTHSSTSWPCSRPFTPSSSLCSTSCVLPVRSYLRVSLSSDISFFPICCTGNSWAAVPHDSHMLFDDWSTDQSIGFFKCDLDRIIDLPLIADWLVWVYAETMMTRPRLNLVISVFREMMLM